MSNTKITVIAVVSIVGVVGLGWGFTYLQLAHRSHFKPKFADVERETFERTKSYNKAMHQDLVRYRRQYQRAKLDDNQEDMNIIRITIQDQFADYDRSLLQQDMRDFLDQEIFN